MTPCCVDTTSMSYLSPWNPFSEGDQIPKMQVTTAFLQKGNEFLVLQRAKKDVQHQLWGIPGGKLDQGESPITALVREIQEETTIDLSRNVFQLLGTAMSHTPCDGQYGLYIYHTRIDQRVDVLINTTEHSAFRWVSIDEFISLNLLTAQMDAFKLVEDKLKQTITSECL